MSGWLAAAARAAEAVLAAPAVAEAPIRARSKWTAQQRSTLMALVRTQGQCWTKFSARADMGGRSPNALECYFTKYLRDKMADSVSISAAEKDCVVQQMLGDDAEVAVYDARILFDTCVHTHKLSPSGSPSALCAPLNSIYEVSTACV